MPESTVIPVLHYSDVRGAVAWLCNAFGFIERLCARAEAAGGRIVSPPATFPYGERQYSVVDPGGHVWTFSQTVASVHPDAWVGY